MINMAMTPKYQHKTWKSTFWFLLVITILVINLLLIMDGKVFYYHINFTEEKSQDAESSVKTKLPKNREISLNTEANINTDEPISYPKSPINCFRAKSSSLPEITDEDPPKGESIFFLETSCRHFDQGHLGINARQACAIESAARMNKHKQIYLLYCSPGLIVANSSSFDFFEELLLLRNIKIMHLDYGKFVLGTPIDELFKSGKIDKSQYSIVNASDLLRLLILYKYGGIYMDLDVVAMKSFDDFPKNFIGMESADASANGIMGFDYTGIGHDHVEACLLDVQKNYDGNQWGQNGPALIKRMLTKWCGTNITLELHGKTCGDVKIYPQNTFYAIPWRKWEMFFLSNKTKEVLAKTKDSVAIHLWNKFSYKQENKLNTNTAYEVLARKYCPGVYTRIKEFL